MMAVVPLSELLGGLPLKSQLHAKMKISQPVEMTADLYE